MCDEAFQSGFHIFVKAFEQGQTEGVLHLEVLGHVVDGVVAEHVAVVVVPRREIVVGRRLIGLIDTAVVVQFQGVDDARHGDVHLLHGGLDGVEECLSLVETVDGGLTVDLDAGGVGLDAQRVGLGGFACNLGVGGTTQGRGLILLHLFFVGSLVIVLLFFLLRLLGELAGLDLLLGHRNLFVEADIITVTQEDVLVVVTVPVFLQYGRNLVLRITVSVRLGMGDVGIVGDTTVLGSLLVVCREQDMHLILVAQI